MQQREEITPMIQGYANFIEKQNLLKSESIISSVEDNLEEENISTKQIENENIAQSEPENNIQDSNELEFGVSNIKKLKSKDDSENFTQDTAKKPTRKRIKTKYSKIDVMEKLGRSFK